MIRFALLIALLAVAGCGGETDEAPPAQETDVSYTVQGRYLGALYDGEAASIAHEAIPGVMEAMTMPFRLADPALIEGLAPDTPIRFRLEDHGTGFRVTTIEPLPPGTPLDLAP